MLVNDLIYLRYRNLCPGLSRSDIEVIAAECQNEMELEQRLHQLMEQSHDDMSESRTDGHAFDDEEYHTETTGQTGDDDSYDEGSYTDDADSNVRKHPSPVKPKDKGHAMPFGPVVRHVPFSHNRSPSLSQNDDVPPSLNNTTPQRRGGLMDPAAVSSAMRPRDPMAGVDDGFDGETPSALPSFGTVK
ncbi:hypothetical protein KIPB_000704, partial [Kipferlia bialata]|eukprot:g704.t1